MPVGMGMFHFQDVTYTSEDIELHGNSLYIDYFHGRMVKLFITKEDEETWSVKNDLDVKYQSFCHKYKDMADLLSSVEGIEIQ